MWDVSREQVTGTSGRRFAIGVLLAGLACSMIALFPGGGEAKKKGKKQQKRPNIVLLMTDDQTVESLKAMPIVDSKLGNAGVTFETTSPASPSAAPRGRRAHGPVPRQPRWRTNQQPSGGYVEMKNTIGNTLPVWLQRSGYYTAHIGKFLNGYGTGANAPEGGAPGLERVVRIA